MNPEKALAAFSEAVLVPANWGEALEGVAAACDARIVTVVDGVTEGELTCSSGGQAEINLYLNGREIPDSRHARVNPTLAQGFRTDFDDFTPDEIARDPYYQEFLAPLGLGFHAVAALPGPDRTAVISIKRAKRQGPFDAADVSMLNRVLPQFRAAARHAAIVARSRFEGELVAFESVHRAALCVDNEGRILALNKLVEFGDGLVNEGQHLSALFSADHCALERAITFSGGSGSSEAAASPVVVHRPSGKRPLLIDVIPVPAGNLAIPQRTRCIVLINDLNREPRTCRDTLQRAFDLTQTPREADLAQLLATGARLCHAAAELHITEMHARQRLKVLFAKTGTSRQSQLLMLLARTT